VFAGSIYGVRRADEREFRYVGQTKHTVAHRRMQHLKAAVQGRKTPFYDWVRTFDSREDLYFQPLELVAGDPADLNAAEVRWVADLRTRGHRLLNLTDGGDGVRGHVWSEEQRQAASERNRGRRGTAHLGSDNPMWGRTHSEEQKARWSKARKGTHAGAANPNFGKFGPDHPRYGHTMSVESKQRLAEMRRGEGNPNFGKSASDETRAKMSAARKGKPMPSSVRNAHTRHHTNKGVVKDTCRHCIDDRRQASQESEEQ